MKNKNHGNGQNDEDRFIAAFMTIVVVITIVSIIIEIATWFIK